MSDLEKQFKTAAEEALKLGKRPDNDALLSLYAYYKQATQGDVTGKRPGFTDLTGRAKWDAWARIKGTSKTQAMQSYVDLVERLKR